MSWLLLVLGILSMAFVANAFIPVRRNIWLFLPSFLASWLAIELAWLTILLEVVLTGVLVWAGALDHWTGWLGLGLAVAQLDPPGRHHRVVPRRPRERRRRCWRRSGWSTIPGPVLDDLPHPRRPLRPGRRSRPEARRPRPEGRRAPTAPSGPRCCRSTAAPGSSATSASRACRCCGPLARDGWVGFNANYRLSPAATWPDHLVDLKRALAFIREHADEYGVDPDFIAVTGGSAGGHLAAHAGAHPGRSPLPARLRGRRHARCRRACRSTGSTTSPTAAEHHAVAVPRTGSCSRSIMKAFLERRARAVPRRLARRQRPVRRAAVPRRPRRPRHPRPRRGRPRPSSPPPARRPTRPSCTSSCTAPSTPSTSSPRCAPAGWCAPSSGSSGSSGATTCGRRRRTSPTGPHHRSRRRRRPPRSVRHRLTPAGGRRCVGCPRHDRPAHGLAPTPLRHHPSPRWVGWGAKLGGRRVVGDCVGIVPPCTFRPHEAPGPSSGGELERSILQ